MIRIMSASYKVGQRYLLKEIEIDLSSRQILSIIGANGAGKSTLLNLMAGDLTPSVGQIFLSDQCLRTYDLTVLARKRAVLQQQYHLPFSVKANAVFEMGNAPFHRFSWSQRVKISSCNAYLIEALSLQTLLNKNYHELSGGEQHRIQIARVLLQLLHEDNDMPEKLLLLDEPFNHLDLHYQQRLIQLLKTLPNLGITVIAVVHDLNHALSLSNQLLLLDQGQQKALLSVQAPNLKAQLSHLFGLDFHQINVVQSVATDNQALDFLTQQHSLFFPQWLS